MDFSPELSPVVWVESRNGNMLHTAPVDVDGERGEGALCFGFLVMHGEEFLLCFFRVSGDSTLLGDCPLLEDSVHCPLHPLCQLLDLFHGKAVIWRRLFYDEIHVLLVFSLLRL